MQASKRPLLIDIILHINNLKNLHENRSVYCLSIDIMVPVLGSNTRPPSSKNPVSPETNRPLESRVVEASLASLQKALSAYEEDPNSEIIEHALLSARRAASTALAALHRSDRQCPSVATARGLIARILRTSAFDTPIAIEDASNATELVHQGWPGLLGAMLLTPAWQWPQAPALEKAPDWLWGDYATWLFTPPQLFTTAGQSEVFARHILSRMDELAGWADRNPGSATVRSALEAYLTSHDRIPLYLSNQDLPHHAKLRGRLLLRSHPKIDSATDMAPIPREGRKLRVAIVCTHLAPSHATLSLIPLLQQLDSERFELQIFVQHNVKSPVEKQFVQRGARRLLLAGETDAARVQTLRDAFIDIAVFVPQEQTLSEDPVTTLCARRIAPLQLVHDGSGQPVGLTGCDLFLSSKLPAPHSAGTSTERAALLPGLGALTINDLQSTPPENWTRSALGIPEEAFVWLAYIDQHLVSPELQETWACLLARQPDARLILLVDDHGQAPLNRFGNLFGKMLLCFNVDENRATIFPCSVMTHDERQAYLGLADALLVAPSAAAPEWAIAAIESGILPLCAPGNARASAILRLLGVESLSTATSETCVETALRLAQDKPWRESLLATATAALPGTLALHDAFVQSEAFGQLIERAFDECMVSRQEFAHAGTPIEPASIIDANAVQDEAIFFMELGANRDAAQRARALMINNPASTESRKLLATAYAAQQRYTEAADLRLSVVNLEPDAAINWHEFALSARQSDRHAEACDALQTALRIEPGRVDSWLLLAQISKSVGHEDMYQEVLSVLKQLAPDHPEVCKLMPSFS